MHKLGVGYTKYFNQKYNRRGALFATSFQAVHIKTENELIRVSTYINANPEIHQICPATEWLWSSYQDYLGLREGNLSNKQEVLKFFRNINEYYVLARQIIKDSQKLKKELKDI